VQYLYHSLRLAFKPVFLYKRTLMNLYTAIQASSPLHVAIVGAGGKTTALFQLARQCPGPVWVTTTTHLGTDQISLADRHFVLGSRTDFSVESYAAQKVTLLTGPFTQDNRVRGPEPDLLEHMRREADRLGIPLLMESDGSRSIPLKAPGEHEPPIPAWATHALVLVGLSAVGKSLSEETVYRSKRFSEITGLAEGQSVTLAGIREMLIHPLGGLKNIPAGARKIVVFNQADTPDLRARVEVIVEDLLNGGYDNVVIGALGRDPDGLQVFSKNA
jgi:molybdenum cofactor cytidylyltransferase